MKIHLSNGQLSVLELTKNDEIIGVLGALNASVKKFTAHISGKGVWFWHLFVGSHNTRIIINKNSIHSLIKSGIIICNDDKNNSYYLIGRIHNVVNQPWSMLYREQRSREQEYLK